jgi:hypothetical protein
MADAEAAEQEIKKTLHIIQSMIDVSAERLEGLRTQCATSAELTQQEIRTLEVNWYRSVESRKTADVLGQTHQIVFEPTDNETETAPRGRRQRPLPVPMVASGRAGRQLDRRPLSKNIVGGGAPREVRTRVTNDPHRPRRPSRGAQSTMPGPS